MTQSEIHPPDDPEEEARTGLAGLSTWPRVYGFVMVVFVGVVVVLWGFQVIYS